MQTHKIKLALLILFVLGALVGVKIVGLDTINLWLQQFILYVEGLGWWGVVLYVIVFGISAMAALPASPFVIGAGIIFKFWLGLGISLAGIGIGAALGFLASRYLARDLVVEKLKDSPKFRAIDTAVGNEGWKIVTLLRICPLPFGLSNFIYGVTSIRFDHYMLATFLGVLPSLGFFVYLGSAGKATLDSMGNKNPALLIPLGLGVIAGVVCLIFVGRVARRAVARATRENPIAAPELKEIREG